VLQVQTMLILTMIVIAPLMGVGGAIMALRQDVQLSKLLLIAVPILALIIGFLTLRATPQFQRMQKQLDGVTPSCANRSTASGRLMAAITPALTTVM
jgi:ATP-binding cassette, subfamily B, multidrug efflux pump